MRTARCGDGDRQSEALEQLGTRREKGERRTVDRYDSATMRARAFIDSLASEISLSTTASGVQVRQ